jgi:hypothetical protein
MHIYKFTFLIEIAVLSTYILIVWLLLGKLVSKKDTSSTHQHEAIHPMVAVPCSQQRDLIIQFIYTFPDHQMGLRFRCFCVQGKFSARPLLSILFPTIKWPTKPSGNRVLGLLAWRMSWHMSHLRTCAVRACHTATICLKCENTASLICSFMRERSELNCDDRSEVRLAKSSQH